MSFRSVRALVMQTTFETVQLVLKSPAAVSNIDDVHDDTYSMFVT